MSLSYSLAGIHMEPPLMRIGTPMFAACLVMFFMSATAWTIVSTGVAAGMIVTATAGGVDRDARP